MDGNYICIQKLFHLSIFQEMKLIYDEYIILWMGMKINWNRIELSSINQMNSLSWISFDNIWKLFMMKTMFLITTNSKKFQLSCIICKNKYFFLYFSFLIFYDNCWGLGIEILYSIIVQSWFNSWSMVNWSIEPLEDWKYTYHENRK